MNLCISLFFQQVAVWALGTLSMWLTSSSISSLEEETVGGVRLKSDRIDTRPIKVFLKRNASPSIIILRKKKNSLYIYKNVSFKYICFLFFHQLEDSRSAQNLPNLPPPVHCEPCESVFPVPVPTAPYRPICSVGSVAYTAPVKPLCSVM